MRRNQTRSKTSFAPLILVVATSIAIVILMGMGSPSTIPGSALAPAVVEASRTEDVLESIVRPARTQPHETSTSSLDLNQAFLWEVLQAHPKKEVYDVLWPRIASGDISIKWIYGTHADGHFRPAPVEDADGHMVNLMGSISIPLDLVDRARRGDSVRIAYLHIVLLHEAVHYEQIASGRFSPDVILKEAATPEECVAGWQLEREAYERECRFAMSVGQDWILRSYCTTLEPEAFDRNLFEVLQPRRTDNCPTFWMAELRK